MMEIIKSDLFLLVLTIGMFLVSGAIFRKVKMMIFHPVLFTAVVLIVFLKLTGIEYAHYKSAVGILDFTLGMSVVALGYLMYAQL